MGSSSPLTVEVDRDRTLSSPPTHRLHGLHLEGGAREPVLQRIAAHRMAIGTSIASSTIEMAAAAVTSRLRRTSAPYGGGGQAYADAAHVVR